MAARPPATTATVLPARRAGVVRDIGAPGLSGWGATWVNATRRRLPAPRARRARGTMPPAVRAAREPGRGLSPSVTCGLPPARRRRAGSAGPSAGRVGDGHEQRPRHTPPPPPPRRAGRLGRRARRARRGRREDDPRRDPAGPAGAAARPPGGAPPGGRERAARGGPPRGPALLPSPPALPTGTWTSAAVLALTGGRAARPAAERLVATGILAAVPTAASG